jgi:predicted dehydrogenase
MQIGFIGLGAVVETAYLPALRRLGYVIDNCWGYDLDSSRALPGIQRCSSLSALLAKPWRRSSLPPHHFSICPCWRER